MGGLQLRRATGRGAGVRLLRCAVRSTPEQGCSCGGCEVPTKGKYTLILMSPVPSWLCLQASCFLATRPHGARRPPRTCRS